MSVQKQQFRVVGVNRGSGTDVSVVIDAATKAAAEVKAEQMNIETTHIVRLKQHEPTPPSEHELFSAEAAEALTTKRTEKLIEEVIAPSEMAPPAPPAPEPQVQRQARNEPHPIASTISRPTYAAPSRVRDLDEANISGFRAFSFVLIILLSITAGAYFVLVHEPNNVVADQHELVFGEDLFSDVVDNSTAGTADASGVFMRDAFNGTSSGATLPDEPPIAKDQQIVLGPIEPASPKPAAPVKLELQSVVTSHEGRFAVINGKLYKQGAVINGQKLVEIADDWVLLETNGEQRVLQIAANKQP